MQNIVSFIGLFCKRDLSFKEPTNRSHCHPIAVILRVTAASSKNIMQSDTAASCGKNMHEKVFCRRIVRDAFVSELHCQLLRDATKMAVARQKKNTSRRSVAALFVIHLCLNRTANF